jgi:hypothetical protein
MVMIRAPDERAGGSYTGFRASRRGSRSPEPLSDSLGNWPAQVLYISFALHKVQNASRR